MGGKEENRRSWTPCQPDHLWLSRHVCVCTGKTTGFEQLCHHCPTSSLSQGNHQNVGNGTSFTTASVGTPLHGRQSQYLYGQTISQYGSGSYQPRRPPQPWGTSPCPDDRETETITTRRRQSQPDAETSTGGNRPFRDAFQYRPNHSPQ